MRSLGEYSFNQYPRDSLGDATGLGREPEQVQDVEAEPDGMRVGIPKLVDDRVEEMVLS